MFLLSATGQQLLKSQHLKTSTRAYFSIYKAHIMCCRKRFAGCSHALQCEVVRGVAVFLQLSPLS